MSICIQARTVRNLTRSFSPLARSILHPAPASAPASTSAHASTYATRSYTSASQSSTSHKMPPPPKKMVHLESINAIPSQYSEFRNVLWTGESSQLVVMTIPVGGDIGEEVHTVDQHLIFTSGTCKAVVGGEEKEVKAGDLVIVPQGTKHNFINTGPTPLCLFTVYAPAEHDPKSVHQTKEEGDELEDAGKDEAPEWATKGKSD